MRSAILGFAAGVGYLQMQAALPTVTWLMLLGVFLILLLLFMRAYRLAARPAAVSLILSAACGLLAGFVWAATIAHFRLSEELPSSWEGRDVTVVGTIENLPYRFEQGVRFNLAVERVLPVEGVIPPVPGHLALSWYAGFRSDPGATVAEVLPGERWQLTVRLRRPHGNANPYGFDYEAWLLEQDLRASGYVRPDRDATNKNSRLTGFVWSFGNAVERSRYWLRERIMTVLAGKEYAGIVAALVIGDQRAVSQSDWQVFNRTGVGHLISISGLHITMVAGLFAGLIMALWRRSFFTGLQLPLILPAQKAAALAGALIALVYVLLAGFGVPAQRTLYMLTVVAAAVWFDRITSVSHVLCLALGVVVLLDPWAVLWPGFWLSFGAVAMILYATVGRTQSHGEAELSPLRRWHGLLKTAGHTQYVVTLGLVPLTLLLFAQVSLISPLANAVAIPLISFIVTPLSLIGSIAPDPLCGWLLAVAHECISWLAVVLKWMSAQSMAVWSAPAPPWGWFIVALAGTCWMLAPRGWPMRWVGLLAWAPLLFHTPLHPKPGEMWVTAFDVGQGTALLVETSGHRLLYDTGPLYSADADGGNRVILPYLKARGIDRLDGMVVSHSDADHSGGALSVLDELRVDWVASSLAPDSPIALASNEHRRCAAGQSWTWDDVQFEILHPSGSHYDNPKSKPNARSCTLKITRKMQSILLTGDIEAPQEAELLAHQPEKLPSSVLLAPHHGSGTSSTEAFLTAVQPQIALFQVGYRNRYHHPKTEVFQRYGEHGIKRVRSDDSGAVTLAFGDAITLTEYRSEHARYWYGR